jgi:hypothetical protein
VRQSAGQSLNSILKAAETSTMIRAKSLDKKIADRLPKIRMEEIRYTDMVTAVSRLTPVFLTATEEMAAGRMRNNIASINFHHSRKAKRAIPEEL